MHHFFVAPSQIDGVEIRIHGTDVNHMKNVLRMKPGEQMEVSDGAGTVYLCELKSYEAEQAILHIADSRQDRVELASKVYLFQGLPKSDKLELIVQKAVELGVYEIIPVATRRSVVRLDEKKAGKKVQRWNAIAESAAKQSGRNRIPQVHDVMTFPQTLAYARDFDVKLIPYEKAEGMDALRRTVDGIGTGQSVGVWIGPEGGFETEEVEQAAAAGAEPVSLGRRILRTETAGIAVLSILMYHLECSSHNL